MPENVSDEVKFGWSYYTGDDWRCAVRVVGVDGISVGMIAEVERHTVGCNIPVMSSDHAQHTVRIKRLFEVGGVPAAEVEFVHGEHNFYITVQRTSLLDVRLEPDDSHVTIGLLREVQEGEKMCRHGNYGRCEVCEIEETEEGMAGVLGLLESVEEAAALGDGARVRVLGGTFEYMADGADLPYRMLAFLVENGGVVERTGL